ncbi:MAG: hypothetical protein WC289_02695 [Patescibacteria group bacterium]|jgi:hypothetical protein
MIKKHAKKITPEDLKERAMQAGTSWHHHTLSVDCYVNDINEEIVVLEVGDDTFYSPTSKELREDLEQHAYELTGSKTPKGRVPTHEALEMVKELHRKGTRWHFHITRPHCFLNISDKFVLIVENDRTKKKYEWFFDEKPVELVRAIDDYYLGRKK